MRYIMSMKNIVLIIHVAILNVTGNIPNVNMKNTIGG